MLRRVEFGYHDPEPPIIVASHTPAATHPNPTPKLTHRYVRRARYERLVDDVSCVGEGAQQTEHEDSGCAEVASNGRCASDQ